MSFNLSEADTIKLVQELAKSSNFGSVLERIFKESLSKNQKTVLIAMLEAKMVKPDEEIVKYSLDHNDVLKVLIINPETDLTNYGQTIFKKMISEENLEMMELLLSNIKVPKIVSIFYDQLIKNNKIEMVKLMLKYIDPAKDSASWAFNNRHYELTKILLEDERIDPDYSQYKSLLVKTCESNHVELVQILLADKRVNPGFRKNYAIQMAAHWGHAEVVKLLLADPRVNPADDNNLAIVYACESGKIEVVQLLLNDSRVNPAGNENKCIRKAIKCGHTEVVKLLIPRTDLRTISDPRIIDIASGMDNLSPDQKSFLVLTVLMKDLSIKEIDIEIGKRFNLILESGGDICDVCNKVSFAMNTFKIKKVHARSGKFDVEFA